MFLFEFFLERESAAQLDGSNTADRADDFIAVAKAFITVLIKAFRIRIPDIEIIFRYVYV